jgi:hypothetical protein
MSIFPSFLDKYTCKLKFGNAGAVTPIGSVCALPASSHKAIVLHVMHAISCRNCSNEPTEVVSSDSRQMLSTYKMKQAVTIRSIYIYIYIYIYLNYSVVSVSSSFLSTVPIAKHPLVHAFYIIIVRYRT